MTVEELIKRLRYLVIQHPQASQAHVWLSINDTRYVNEATTPVVCVYLKDCEVILGDC